MATAKRDRQRANRDAKREIERKVARRQKVLHQAKRIGMWAGLFVILVVITNLIFG